MSEWPTVKFHELSAKEKSSISKPYGSAFTKNDYTSHGIPMVRGINLAKGIFHDDDFTFISTEKANKVPGAKLKSGDLVFTHRGTVGQVSMIPRKPKFEIYVASTSQVKARLDPSLALPEFYYYWFRSPEGQQRLLSNTSTVGVPGLGQPVATIKAIDVPHPPISVQQAITAALGALDDKIAANERIARTASDLATSHFKLHTISAGKVSLARIASPVLGGTPDRQMPAYWGGSVPWASARDVAKAESGVLLDTEEKITHSATENTRAKPVPEGSVIITARGTVGAVARTTKASTINQSCYAFIPGIITRSVLYETVLMAAQESLNVSHGTVFSTLNMKSFEHLLVPSIEKEQAATIEKAIHPLHRSVEGALQESRALAELRDTLLPQLMSGKLRVKDAEKIVEDNV